jgi:hypothetical protein
MSQEIIYTIEDDDAAVATSYEIRITFNAYEGSFGRYHEDQPHVADICIAEVLRVYVGDDSFVPIGKTILEEIRKRYGDCEAIEERCWNAAFVGAPDPSYQRMAANGRLITRSGRDCS